MSSKSRRKSVRKETLTQIAAMAAEFDKEFVADEFGPMNTRQRRKWEKAKRGPGRPKVGKGSKIISVSIEQGLLKSADSFAKAKGITRAKLIAIGLHQILAKGAHR
jgi:hypothetical protein